MVIDLLVSVQRDIQVYNAKVSFFSKMYMFFMLICLYSKIIITESILNPFFILNMRIRSGLIPISFKKRSNP